MGRRGEGTGADGQEEGDRSEKQTSCWLLFQLRLFCSRKPASNETLHECKRLENGLFDFAECIDSMR